MIDMFIITIIFALTKKTKLTQSEKFRLVNDCLYSIKFRKKMNEIFDKFRIFIDKK